MKVIYFDLDGPLLDVSDKYFRTYFDILSGRGYSPIDKFLYWELKRNKTPEKEILALSGADKIGDEYRKKRKEIIETDEYMAFDTLQPSGIEILNILKRADFQIILVTLRSSPVQLEMQLKKLLIWDYFSEVLSSGKETDPRWKIKYDLISERGGGHPYAGSFFVGDTETDIIAANELGLTSVAVMNGIRNLQQIKNASPKHILSGINQFLKFIN